MTEYFYLDYNGQLLGSIHAYSFRDAHIWLAMNGISYHTVSKYKPKVRRPKPRQRTGYMAHA